MMCHIMAKNYRVYWNHTKDRSLRVNILIGEGRQSFWVSPKQRSLCKYQSFMFFGTVLPELNALHLLAPDIRSTIISLFGTLHYVDLYIITWLSRTMNNVA
jgi:hypothetical protein